MPRPRKTTEPLDRNGLRQAALRLLTRREYGYRELMQRLQRRSPDTDLITRVLDELAAQGFLSDARFAESFARSKRGQYSKRMIAHQLKERGIDADTASAALDDPDVEAVAEEDELRALWLRHFGTPPADEKEKARQVRWLMARGYSLSMVLALLRAEGGGRRTEDG